MNLLEHEGKQLLSEFGINIPKGVILAPDDDVTSAASALGFPLFVKAQVPIGGRGKAGGIVKVDSMAHLIAESNRIAGMSIRGYQVTSILLEEMVHGDRDIYVSISIDRRSGSPALLVGREGGMDIESSPADSMTREILDVFEEIPASAIARIEGSLNLPKESRRPFAEFLHMMWSLFRTKDLELLEINPLTLSSRNGRFTAIDAKVVFNDDAVFRHPNMKVAMDRGLSPWEAECRIAGLVGVQLDGTIGVIANGAGLNMATLDTISDLGMTGGAFLDLGGTDDPEKVALAIRLMIMSKDALGLDGILINIFGGITRCDTVAKGVLQAAPRRHDIPIVVRMRGVNEIDGRLLLTTNGIPAFLVLDEAIYALLAEVDGK